MILPFIVFVQCGLKKMVKDKTVLRWRIRREEVFELEYGEIHFPSKDYAWNMIVSEEGGWVQFEDCRRGFHEYEWMAAICDYVCFFCLDVEPRVEEDEEFDSQDEFFIGPINPRRPVGRKSRKVKVVLKNVKMLSGRMMEARRMMLM